MCTYQTSGFFYKLVEKYTKFEIQSWSIYGYLIIVPIFVNLFIDNIAALNDIVRLWKYFT